VHLQMVFMARYNIYRCPVCGKDVRLQGKGLSLRERLRINDVLPAIIPIGRW